MSAINSVLQYTCSQNSKISYLPSAFLDNELRLAKTFTVAGKFLYQLINFTNQLKQPDRKSFPSSGIYDAFVFFQN